MSINTSPARNLGQCAQEIIVTENIEEEELEVVSENAGEPSVMQHETQDKPVVLPPAPIPTGGDNGAASCIDLTESTPPFLKSSRRPLSAVTTSCSSPSPPAKGIVPKGWPTLPTVAGDRRAKAVEICSHIALACVSALLLIFALLSASVHNTYPGRLTRYSDGQDILLMNLTYTNGDPVIEDVVLTKGGEFELTPSRPNHLNLGLLQIAKLGPTVLPIAFAAIIGNFLRVVSRRKAEIGASIQTLELLVNSRSLFNAVSTVFSIRAMKFLSSLLILIWSLSTLEGQASLRIPEKHEITSYQSYIPWQVQSPGFGEDHSVNTTLSKHWILKRAGWWRSMLDSGSSSIVLSRNTSSDTNYMPVLPTPDSDLKNFTAGGVSEVNLTKLVGPSITTSRLGRNISGTFISTFAIWNGIVSFPVSSFEIRCPSMSVVQVDPTRPPDLRVDTIYKNESNLSSVTRTGSGFFFEIASQFTNELQLGAKQLDPLYPLKCDLVSIGEPTRSAWTPLSNDTIALYTFRLWQNIDRGGSNDSSLTEKFIANGAVDLNASLVDLSVTDNVTFATRLTCLFNTFWGQTQNMLSLAKGDNPPQYVDSMSSTPLTIAPFTIIKCNWIWFSIVTFTSLLLLVCSLLSAWLRYKTTTPEIMGYVSSMTLENPYATPPGLDVGSANGLNGLDRARLLKNFRVRIGDVRANEEVGKIALATEGEGVQAYRNGRKVVRG